MTDPTRPSGARPGHDPLRLLVGAHSEMDAVRRFLRRAARVTAPVLIEGETGTGKSLAARLLHQSGPRRAAPFVAVNCACIPEGLFESELFGHRRGAFTGATEHRAGLFEAAGGGTLFLDEVGELDPSRQARLLTALEEGRIRRVGEQRSRPIDVRIVAATVRDLDAALADGAFRMDLFHRLALLRCRLPVLRQRPGDVQGLALRFAEKHGRRHRGRPASLTPTALGALRAHSWPGNVRELSHVLEAAVIMADRDRLDREDIEPLLERRAGGVRAGGDDAGGVDGSGTRISTRYSFHGTEEEEREVVLAALERHRGNRTRTAADLGMSRNTLRNRLRRWGLQD